jgi:hypothetical protein
MAHWISTQISGQRESARVLLMSLPYALKAADAEKLGGLPASAFMHANNGGVAANGGSPASAHAGTLGARMLAPMRMKNKPDLVWDAERQKL